VPNDQRIIAAMNKVGEFKLALAFRKSKFVYGTQGSGSKIVKGLRNWAAKVNGSTRPGVTQQLRTRMKALNLFDPGRRAEVYLSGDYQMMDLYYGQAGTNLHEKRNPEIAAFVHYAMGYKGEFSMKQSGRDEYLRTFNTKAEGWNANDPNYPKAAMYDGLTATKEISRIIRWGIQKFGGSLIFEGKELYYNQVFLIAPARIGDTDEEARALFTYFQPGVSSVPFGKGRLVFHWNGKETVPTKLHFLSNWHWHQGSTHTVQNMLKAGDWTRQGLGSKMLPIWDNFLDVPYQLAAVPKTDLADTVIS